MERQGEKHTRWQHERTPNRRCKQLLGIGGAARFLMVLAAGSSVALFLGTPAHAKTCETFTVPIFPARDGELPSGAAILLTDETCEYLDPYSLLVSVPIAELDVDVDGTPATLEPFPGFDIPYAWQIVPAPAVGARVTITGCDEAAREDPERCATGGLGERPDSGPWFSWAFNVVEAEDPPPTLRAPTLGIPIRESFVDESLRVIEWSVDVSRELDQTRPPMLVRVRLVAGIELESTSVFAHPSVAAQTYTFVGETTMEACVTAQTFDLYGNEGPTSRVRCNRPPLDGCRLANEPRPGLALMLGLGLLGLRRPTRPARRGRSIVHADTPCPPLAFDRMRLHPRLQRVGRALSSFSPRDWP